MVITSVKTCNHNMIHLQYITVYLIVLLLFIFGRDILETVVSNKFEEKYNPWTLQKISSGLFPVLVWVINMHIKLYTC